MKNALNRVRLSGGFPSVRVEILHSAYAQLYAAVLECNHSQPSHKISFLILESPDAVRERNVKQMLVKCLNTIYIKCPRDLAEQRGTNGTKNCYQSKYGNCANKWDTSSSGQITLCALSARLPLNITKQYFFHQPKN